MDNAMLRYRLLKEATKHRVLPNLPKELKKNAASNAPHEMAAIIDDLSRTMARHILQEKVAGDPNNEKDIRTNGLFVFTQREMNDLINSVVNEPIKPITSSLIPPSEEGGQTRPVEKPKHNKPI